MEYPIKLYQIETVDGFEWVAEYPDVPGCVGGGLTKLEAMTSAEENLGAHLEAMKELGLPIPEPSKIENDSYSGKFVFRTTKSTHRKLSELAEKEGVSLNQIMNDAANSFIAREETMSIYNKALNDVSRFINQNCFEPRKKFSVKSVFSPINSEKYGGYNYGTN